MPIGILNCELRDKKDHFVTTIYKELRQKLQIKPSSILLLEINNREIIKIPNKDFHITIPKRLVRPGLNRVEIKILKVYDKDKGKLRTNLLFLDDYANIGAFIPKKTIFGNEIFVLDANDYIYVWYSIGGGAEHIKIKKRFNAEKLAELIGFYFGDGNTSKEIRSFRLNNCESSTLDYCLNILEDLGIPKSFMKLQVIYSSYKEIDNKTRKRCIGHWSRSLNLNKNQIVSVNLSKNKNESLLYGSARIFFDNSIFVEVFLHGILNRFIEIVKNPKNKLENKILEGFLRGLAAAEGGITLTKLNSLSKIGLSYNPHSDDLNFYKTILKNLGVGYGGIHGNELIIYGIKNFRIFKKIDLFKMHKKRKDKFELGYKNHKFAN